MAGRLVDYLYSNVESSQNDNDDNGDRKTF